MGEAAFNAVGAAKLSRTADAGVEWSTSIASDFEIPFSACLASGLTLLTTSGRGTLYRVNMNGTHRLPGEDNLTSLGPASSNWVCYSYLRVPATARLMHPQVGPSVPMGQ